MKRTFKWDEDGDYGWGWIPTFMGDRAGVVAFPAHDILEHRKGDTPNFAQEMMALGRSLYTRARYGGYGRNQTPGAVLGEDIGGSDLLGRERDYGREIPDAPRHVDLRRLPKDIADIINKASPIWENALWASEFDRGGAYDDAAELCGGIERGTMSQREDQAIKDWLALGYMDAVRRFGRYQCDPYDICCLYDRINKEFVKLKDGEPGDLATIRVDLRTRGVEITSSRGAQY